MSKQASKLHETSSERNETAVAEVGGKKGGGAITQGLYSGASRGSARSRGYPRRGRGSHKGFPTRHQHSLLPCELRTDSPAFPKRSSESGSECCFPVLSPAAARSAPKKVFLICVAVGLLLPPSPSPPTCPHMWMYSPLDYVTRLFRCMRQFAELSWC